MKLLVFEQYQCPQFQQSLKLRLFNILSQMLAQLLTKYISDTAFITVPILLQLLMTLGILLPRTDYPLRFKSLPFWVQNTIFSLCYIKRFPFSFCLKKPNVSCMKRLEKEM